MPATLGLFSLPTNIIDYIKWLAKCWLWTVCLARRKRKCPEPEGHEGGNWAVLFGFIYIYIVAGVVAGSSFGVVMEQLHRSVSSSLNCFNFYRSRRLPVILTRPAATATRHKLRATVTNLQHFALWLFADGSAWHDAAWNLALLVSKLCHSRFAYAPTEVQLDLCPGRPSIRLSG